jgi:queuine tRNA-ribosyltransferase
VTSKWFDFNIEQKDGKARAGTFNTPNGEFATPIFAPVGTQATVKSVTPAQLEEIGASLVLANTYHLFLRPGENLIAELGGLHTFMNWKRPILTDSGGFQVFSLSETRKVDEDGVNFKSHIDGSIHRFTPEKSIQIQESLGADIIMAFDECAEPDQREYSEAAMLRTHRWLERCVSSKRRTDQALFGIVQGGIFADLRRQSAEFIAMQDLPGYAIGGLSVGESKADMHAMIEIVNGILPQEKPRYLLGVGSPEDLINGIWRGVDIFDCVLPTRLARHHAAFTPTGRINLANTINTSEKNPIDDSCRCYTCRNFSRAYIRHLILAKEMLAGTLVSIHNLYFLLEITRRARQAIQESRFDSFAQEFLNKWHTESPSDEFNLRAQ